MKVTKVIAEIWNGLTFDDVQSVLSGSLRMGESIFKNKRDFACRILANVEIGRGRGLSLPCILMWYV
jgi:hypothetical protein